MPDMSALVSNSHSRLSSRNKSDRTGASSWLRRARTSKRMRKRIIMVVVYVAIVLACFLIGYAIFGPSFTNSE